MYEDYKTYVTADELKIKLDNKEQLMLFDIRDSSEYEQKHIPSSVFAVCNEESKQKIMPFLPKDMEIILVADDENFPKQVSDMMRQIGLHAKYLKGGISSWKWGFDASKPGKDISPKELKLILDSRFSTSNKQQSVFLLDVRQPDQFKQWNIDGSINIPLDKLSLQESLSLIPKDKKIVTICPRGNMSTIAKLALERYGYNASSLEGGLKAWSFSFEYASAEYNSNSKNAKIRLIQFRRIGKGCISYLIDSSGQSIVIDPVYPVGEYVQKATEIGTKISKVVDTHQHADHVSAAKDLSKLTGAKYYQSSYESYVDEQDSEYQQLKDGDVLDVGNVNIKILYTPGHTAGSLSFLVESNENHNNKKLLLTGDTLFVNGIGRPDLRDKAKEFSSMLYDTLHNKLLSLPKDVIVFPAHFDKDVPSQQVISSTLEEIEKKGSQLLKLDKQSFIEKVSSLVMPSPSNFKDIIDINSGKRPVPQSDKSFDLEMGPNRCSISM